MHNERADFWEYPPAPAWMSHVTYECVVGNIICGWGILLPIYRIHESCHIWMSSQSHFTHVDESYHVWVSYGSCHMWMRHFTTHITYKWVMSHLNEFSVFTCDRMDESCHVWVRRYGSYHMWMRHFTTHIPYKWVMSHVNEFSVLFHTCEWDMRHVTCR